jgi:hypothetical protein
VCVCVCSAATLPRFFPASQHSRTEWCSQAALTELLRPGLVKVKLIPVRSSVFWPCAALSVWPAFLLRKRAFQWNNINPLRLTSHVKTPQKINSAKLHSLYRSTEPAGRHVRKLKIFSTRCQQTPQSSLEARSSTHKMGFS